ncbi:MAG: Organic solvent tolerance protein OstA [Chlorobi bacterium OLB7]|nr:MAG: Organic solvent tolerance protein OstA [Chlorobi bacterium OLB7]
MFPAAAMNHSPEAVRNPLPVLGKKVIAMLFAAVLPLLAGVAAANAQPQDGAPDSSAVAPPPDSITVRPLQRSTLDTTVRASARRSVLDLKAKKARLYGDATLVKGSIILKAHYIEVDFNKSEMYAESEFDSARGRYVGQPVQLNDGTTPLTADKLSYNFKTRQGVVAAAETSIEGGYVHFDRFKKVTENVLYGQNGVYTTCDAPHPHYFFTTPRMKVVTGDRVFLDQVTLNIADVPILYLPVGLFFPNRSGRSSGLILPQPQVTGTRGFMLQGMGYFWDISDYLDNTLTTDLYTKGGYTLYNTTRFRLRGVVERSDLTLMYGQTRDDPDLPFNTNIQARYYHSQKIGRRTTLGGSFVYATQNSIRNTQTRLGESGRFQDYTTQDLTSDFSYATSWDWGGSFSATLSRRQNIVTDELLTTVPLSLSLPTWTPFASNSGEGGVFDNLSLGFGLRGTYQAERGGFDSTFPGRFRVREDRYGVTFSPSVSVSPKFSYFTITPFFNPASSLFFRRMVREADGDTIRTRFVDGLYPTFTYNAGVNISTKLFGIVQPKLFGLNAIRHTLLPSIGYSYTPDRSRLGLFRDQFYNPITNQVESYNIFERDGGVASIPSASTKQNNITFALQNQFDAKIAQGDTLPDAKITLLTLNLNTAFNLTADSVGWSDINMNAGTSLGAIGSLSANATLSLYAPDTLGRNTAQMVFGDGRWFPRVVRAGVQFSTNISDQGFGFGGTTTSRSSDTAQGRSNRFDFEPVAFDEAEFYGQRVRGNGEFRIPWSASFGGSYNITPSVQPGKPAVQDFSINTSFQFSPTPTTTLRSSLSYNIRDRQIVIPTISIQKDLHCWEMAFDWQISGYGRGYYFRIGLKAPQLQDLKLEQNRTFF